MSHASTDRLYEKLGVFYLGRSLDPATGETTSEPLLYDSKDLTTHAVCVGMTGSGKTGLCMALLEEAALDGIPAIVIDPKGDLGNLLLSFPAMRAEDFLPWIDPAEAAREELSVEAFAEKAAMKWRGGLQSWDQAPDRIERLRASADFSIYTPGSRSGLPLNVLGSFAAPSTAIRHDDELMRERVSASVSGLLGLIGIEADPLQSREHILLANLIERAWSDGRNLRLPDLIRQIQDPPFDRIGVLDLESIFPAKERFELAIGLNNLLGSPSFASWMEGEPLDVGRLLHDERGRPRVSILSIAHLSDAERMFFVTLLLTEVVAWMRTQPGTASLRAILYMDEIFGFFPPVQNPPAKMPMLTLLKQARAFGLGVVLATQNPVDLDYKGLANAGTWFLGRLQTERDRERILDGLQSVGGADFDRAALSALLSGLRSRVFLMKNIHESESVLFETRWVMSYLRGPLTRQEIQRLMDPRKECSAPSPKSIESPLKVADPGPAGVETHPPSLPPEVPVFYLRPVEQSESETRRWVYRPFLLTHVRVHYVRAKGAIDHWEELTLVTPLEEDKVDLWDEASRLAIPLEQLRGTPIDPATYSLPSAHASRIKSYATWARSLTDHLYRTRTLPMFDSADFKASSNVGETEGAFRARLLQLTREARDHEIAKIRQRHTAELERLRARIAAAEEKRAREKDQYEQQKYQAAVSLGATVLGALFGRKKLSTSSVGRATTTARGVGRAAREREDIARAEGRVETLQEDLLALEETMRDEVDRLNDPVRPEDLSVTHSPVRPRKSDIRIDPIGVMWAPWWATPIGFLEPAFPPESFSATQ
jgi:hypothetical protein